MIARTMTLSVAAVALAVATRPISPSLAADVVDLEMWNAEDLQDGWRASSMTDVAVYGEDGEDIGEVANIVVGPDDQVQSIIVEAGGLFDIGDTHFRVPWDQVDLTPGAEGVQVPVNEDNVANFDLFGDEPGAEPRSWRVSEVMGDYVRLEDGVNYGIVDDLIFDDGGKLK